MSDIQQVPIYTVRGDEQFVSYTFAGKPVFHAELSGPRAELARKYQFAIKELEVTHAYLDHISGILIPYVERMQQNSRDLIGFDSEAENVVVQGLFAAATMSYAKLFMGVGQGRMQFQPRHFFTGEGRRFEKLHSWWMDVRNNYVAHAAAGQYDDARLLAVFPPPEVDSDWYWMFPHVRYQRLPQDPFTIMYLEEMVHFMFNTLSRKQEKLLTHINSNFSKADAISLRSSAVESSLCVNMPPAPQPDEP